MFVLSALKIGNFSAGENRPKNQPVMDEKIDAKNPIDAFSFGVLIESKGG